MNPSPLASLRARLSGRESDARTVAAAALQCANSNAGQNVYLAIEPGRVLAEDAALDSRFMEQGGLAEQAAGPLFGIPVSLKDCFDLAGYRTSCGSRFYAERNGIAAVDSAVAAVLRQQGAVITGKTHLHQLAYGITGENADYGDCVQPLFPDRLTGGSSSGAAASVLEGSAIAAIGTDTGGSIRVPAALCGLAGFRASHGMRLRSARFAAGEDSSAGSKDPWRGAAHLAPSFDTLGWIFRDLRDGPSLAAALFDLDISFDEDVSENGPSRRDGNGVRVGAVGDDFLFDCEAGVLAVFEAWKQRLRSAGATFEVAETDSWKEAFEIFSGIQAHEASVLHRGFFSEFQPDIAERLAWGASISADLLAELYSRLAVFRAQMDRMFDRFDYLMVPCSPVSVLLAGADNSDARRRILRYTTPMSLGGNPVVALPGAGGGVQLVARRGGDSRLLAFAARLG